MGAACYVWIGLVTASSPWRNTPISRAECTLFCFMFWWAYKLCLQDVKNRWFETSQMADRFIFLLVALYTQYARDTVYGCRQVFNLRQNLIQNNDYLFVMSELVFSSLSLYLARKIKTHLDNDNGLGHWQKTQTMKTKLDNGDKLEI